MNAHKLDRTSGGCVCGSAWSIYSEVCSAQVADFVSAWLAAQESWTIVMDQDFYECGKGHAHCSRH